MELIRFHLLLGNRGQSREHAEKILEREVALLDKSGAPTAAKTFILYNPPLVNRELGIRQSAMTPRARLPLISLKMTFRQLFLPPAA